MIRRSHDITVDSVNHFFITVLNRMVGPTYFELKLDNILVKWVKFILNSPNYFYIRAIMEF